MAKNVYIRIFDTHAEYEAFLNSDEFIRPNVSYCKDKNYEVHYSPLEPEPPVPPVSEGTITCLYEVEDAGMLNASTAGYINMHKVVPTDMQRMMILAMIINNNSIPPEHL